MLLQLPLVTRNIKGQKFLDRHSQKCDANFIGYTDVDLLESDLYKQNPEVDVF